MRSRTMLGISISDRRPAVDKKVCAPEGSAALVSNSSEVLGLLQLSLHRSSPALPYVRLPPANRTFQVLYLFAIAHLVCSRSTSSSLLFSSSSLALLDASFLMGSTLSCGWLMCVCIVFTRLIYDSLSSPSFGGNMWWHSKKCSKSPQMTDADHRLALTPHHEFTTCPLLWLLAKTRRRPRYRDYLQRCCICVLGSWRNPHNPTCHKAGVSSYP